MQSRLLITLMIATVLVACRNPLPGQGPSIHGLSASIVSGVTSLAVRPLSGPFPILASTDLHDLRAMIAADGERQLDWQRCVTARVPVDRQDCWLDQTGPTDSLFVAGWFVQPCVNTDIAVSLHGQELDISGNYTPIDCGGARALPEPTFTVLAIPLANIPSKLITLVFDDGNDKAETTVDLRRPAMALPSPVQQFNDETAARTAALGALHKDPQSGAADELAFVRWSSRDSACRAFDLAGAYGDPGYVLRFRVGSMTHEYRWRDGQFVDCSHLVG